MSGNIGEKARAAFLALIMVTSVMAAGVAFTGSAAGQTLSETPDAINATITSNPADFGVDANSNGIDHVVFIEVDNNLANTDLSSNEDIVLDYSSDYTLNGLTVSTGQVDAEIIRSGSSVDDDIVGGTGGDVSVNSGNNNVTITTDDSSPTVQEGDFIRLRIDYGAATGGAGEFVHPSEGGNTNVTIDAVGGTQVEPISLDLGTEAPIEIDDDGSGNSANYSSLQQAISDLDANGEVVTIRENVSELESQPTALGSSGLTPIDLTNSDFQIDGSSASETPFVSVAGLADGNSKGNFIDTSATTDDNNISINTVGFEVDDRIDSGGLATNDVNTFLNTTTGGETGNLTITNSEFVGSAGTAINVTLQDNGDNTGTHEISGNEFSNVAEALNVSASGSNMDDGDSVTISDNNVKSFSGDNAFVLRALASNVDLTFESNDFDGGGNGNNAIALITAVNENVTITDGSVNDVSNNGVLVSDSGGDGVTVSGTQFTNISASAVEVAGVGGDGDGDNIVLDGVSIDSSSSANGLLVNDANALVDVSGSTTINDTIRGIDVTDAEEVIVSGVEITNTDSSNQAIRINDPSNAPDSTIVVNESTSIDQAGTGIEIDVNTDTDALVDVNNVNINGTSSGVDITGVADNSNQAINVTDSTFTNNDAAGLNYSAGNAVTGGPATTRLNVHFNTFENNDVGIGFDDQANTNFKGIFNATFNDFVDNDIAGLDVERIDSDDGGVVNANYSFWGDSTGPSGTISNAFGDGGTVTANNDGDVSVFPFLTDSTDNLTSPEQRNGDQVFVIPDPERPVGASDADNSAVVSVANLNGSAGATNPDVFVPNSGAIVSQKGSFSGTLSPSNVAQFFVNSSSVGTIDVQGVADGASSSTVDQIYTGQATNVSFSANNSGVTSDTPTEITVTAIDSNSDAVERQGLSVRFAESSGFSSGGIEFKPGSRDTNTNNNGVATATVQSDGTLSPGSQFTVSTNVDGNIVSETFTTAAGNISSANSVLRLNGNIINSVNNIQAGSDHVLSAEIEDSNGNDLSGQTVEFSSNGTVDFNSTSVQVDDSGFANTSLTLGEQTQGTVSLNASAGSFSADQTSRARINVTTIAADASQLNVSDVSIAPGNSNPVTVSVQDEFGNVNTSTPNSDITLNTTDQSVISINGQQEATNTSTSGQATFTVTAESDSGSATLTASASGLTADTATASIAEVGGVSLTADDSSIINDANSDNATNFTAEVTDADGNVIQTNESIRFTRVTSSSDAAASSTGAFQVFSGDDGTVTTFRANATGTGDTTFQANIPGTSFSDTATITSTGTADGLTIEANQSTVTAGDKVQINLSVIDTGDRVVPVSRSLSVDTTLGTLDSSGAATTVSTTDGEANVTLNATEAGTADVTVANSGLQTSVTTSITVEEQEQLPDRSITFDDKVVGNTSTDITVESATFNGSQSFNVVVHEATRNDDGTVNIGQKIGESVELDNGTQTDIIVDIDKQVQVPDDNVSQLTEDQVLVAMLHTTNTSDDDDIVHTAPIREDGTENTPRVFDDANITISSIEGTAGDFDSNNDGQILIDELNGGINEFINRDNFGINKLNDVINQFINDQV